MSHRIYRRLQLATFAFLGLILVALALSAGLTLVEQRRLAGARAALQRLHAAQRAQIDLAAALVALQRSAAAGEASRAAVLEQLDALAALTADPEVRRELVDLRARLAGDADGASAQDIAESLALLQQLAVAGDGAEEVVLERLLRDARRQVRMELTAPVVLLLLGVLLVPVARQRIIRPLEAFGRELARVADGDFSPAPAAGVDPLLLPLHRQFNALVRRLDELERAHQVRAVTLQEEVRAATRQLLEQQRRLARAERLAATGELAAFVAHELRNPLAGIRMALVNLRGELADRALEARLDPVLAEIERLARLLAQLLDTARPHHEPARAVVLADLVADVFALLRYEVPPCVRFEARIPPDLVVSLPHDRLEQAVLNLVLNGATAVTPDGGTVTVAAALDGGRLRLQVTDDGPGFPDEVLRAGGRPFLSTRPGGSGLGLAMVRRFARDLGGDFALANRVPRGAEVVLTLPLADGEPVHAAAGA